MFASKPRGPRIVYVSASARELPDEVQQWLSRAEHRAASSPHIYDALAWLASGARPTVMIVNIEAVDWSEMEFFNQAGRLSRETAIYVTGHPYQAAKLDAACKRGAKLFDEQDIHESLSAPAEWSRGPGLSDILAASLPPARPTVTMATAAIKPVPLEPEEPETPEEEVEEAQGEAEATPPSTEMPAVRLIEPGATDVVEEEGGQPIPFPWAPSPIRPQRTPPKARPVGGESASSTPTTPLPSAGMPAPGPRQPAESTADELSALLGRPIAPDKPFREGAG